MTSRRYALRDDQRERIKEMVLPGREGTVGVTAKDNRLFVEAVLYRYRAGIPWRDLPERFGDFRVIHTRSRTTWFS
jgi:transposase